MEKTVSIMIVDDESVSGLLLENLLQREGFTTFSCADGTQAQQLATERQPDLIMLDVNLPQVRGPAICTRLKSNASTAEIPVLFISMDAETATKVECFEAGGQDYITKPYEPREVLARIKTHLRLSRSQRAVGQLLAETIHKVAQAQQALQPPSPAQMPEARFAVHCRQLSQAGGDFFDVIKVSDHVYDYITADVCGHDIGIALATSALKALFTQNCTPISTPAEVLTIINRVMPAVLQQGQYVAVSWIRINRRTNKALAINAGQPPIIAIPTTGAPARLQNSGDIIGIFEHVAFDQRELVVQPGDRFLLYSDGLVDLEGCSPAAREAGIGRLIETCTAVDKTDLSDFVKHLEPAPLGELRPQDDIVILGVEV